jgi:hypothetical protein
LPAGKIAGGLIALVNSRNGAGVES